MIKRISDHFVSPPSRKAFRLVVPNDTNKREGGRLGEMMGEEIGETPKAEVPYGGNAAMGQY